jgi:hypothetical protein
MVHMMERTDRDNVPSWFSLGSFASLGLSNWEC